MFAVSNCQLSQQETLIIQIAKCMSRIMEEHVEAVAILRNLPRRLQTSRTRSRITVVKEGEQRTDSRKQGVDHSVTAWDEPALVV